ncbi:MAG: imidazole glycerol phosphate synthase subunit HisH [Oscillospiraceae bacterium]|nr:imidazole glycerol phosphate synthase subunit HisH [Oscillospiraceae bacterium]
MSIAVIDYGAGNLKSVTKALKYLGFDSVITHDSGELEKADGLILPGVGAFPMCMEMLRSRGLDVEIVKQAAKKPLLGICLGMQMLMDSSTEISLSRGLGLIPGRVERIETDLKLPHIGWNSLRVVNPNPLIRDIQPEDYVYFVHSFAAKVENEADLALTTDYGGTVTAMVARGNVFGCQFHPEKSGPVGMTILKNFGELTK